MGRTPKPSAWPAHRAGVRSEWKWAWEGLIGCWPFWDYNAGHIADVSGLGHHGRITDKANVVWTPTQYGPALDWTAAFGSSNDDRVDTGQWDTKNGGLGITLLALVRTEGGDQGYRWISKADGWAEGSHDWMIGATTIRQMRVRITTSVESTTHLSGNSTLPTDNVWYVVGMTYDSSLPSNPRVKFYLDGDPFSITGGDTGNTSGTVNQDPSVYVALGNQGGGASQWQPHVGKMTFAAVWDHGKTASEMRRLSEDIFAMVSRNPVSYFFGPPAPPGGSIPVFMNHYRRLRSA